MFVGRGGRGPHRNIKLNLTGEARTLAAQLVALADAEDVGDVKAAWS